VRPGRRWSSNGGFEGRRGLFGDHPPTNPRVLADATETLMATGETGLLGTLERLAPACLTRRRSGSTVGASSSTGDRAAPSSSTLLRPEAIGATASGPRTPRGVVPCRLAATPSWRACIGLRNRPNDGRRSSGACRRGGTDGRGRGGSISGGRGGQAALRPRSSQAASSTSPRRWIEISGTPNASDRAGRYEDDLRLTRLLVILLCLPAVGRSL
jgi:hypothetical protein